MRDMDGKDSIGRPPLGKKDRFGDDDSMGCNWLQHVLQPVCERTTLLGSERTLIRLSPEGKNLPSIGGHVFNSSRVKVMVIYFCGLVNT